MGTKENRGRYDRSQQRYPSDLTAEEWRLVPLIPPAKRGGGKRRVDMRAVENGSHPPGALCAVSRTSPTGGQSGRRHHR